MFNFIAFGQNDRLTIRAASYRRVDNRTSLSESYAPNPSPPYFEFVNDNLEVVAVLSEYTYGNIVREDALQENR